MEATSIATLAKCGECRASLGWLGRFSPKPKIRQSGLWLEQHLEAAELGEDSMEVLKVPIRGRDARTPVD